jgi:GNAT superfamily N-acetyltransferase
VELNIIQTQAKHIDDIRQIAAACWKEICPEILMAENIAAYLGAHYDPAVLAQALEDHDSWFYIMLNDERVIGFCLLTRKADDHAVAVYEKILVLPEYQDHKTVYRLFQAALKSAVDDGVTEVEVNVPVCSRRWRDIFTEIGVEFEPWRKFEQPIGGQNLVMWPGMVVIIPGC